MTGPRFPDVEAPTNTRGATSAPPRPERPGEPAEDLLGLAKSDPDAAAARLIAEWEQSWRDIRGYNEQWKVNLWRSEGYLGARLDKVQDRQEAWMPFGISPSLTGLDKAQRLSRRLRSTIFADAPIPQVVPATGQDVAADTAEFQQRILMDESSEGRLSYPTLAADAFEVAKDYGSGFLHFYVDPEGRGPEPVQIKAHPEATRSDDPFLEQSPSPMSPPTSPPAPQAPILKYVTTDGSLTTERYGQPLQQQFLPKLTAEVLTGRHVRLLPKTSRDLWDATAVLIGRMVPLADVKATFPSVAQLDEQDLAALVRYRPTKAAELLPVEQRKYLNTTTVETALVFRLLRYQLPTAETPHGSYIALIGDTHIAHAGEWWDTEHDTPLDLPATQFMHYRQNGNPYGMGSTETLGPGGELLAVMLDAMLEHMDRFGDQKVFVPTTSSVRPEQLEAESHRYIPVSPQGQPVSEQIPDFPIVIEKMYGRISTEMDDESSLQQAGQALEAPSVKSARHFQAQAQQVQVLLSDLRQNTARGLTRGWRVMAQLIRAYYTIPQLLRWEGDDGAYHLKEWAGADLVGLADIQIAPGSFTQMLPMQKAQLARELFLTDRVLTPEQYRRIVFGQFDALLALEDDPHFQRVKRQLDRWLDGPPAGWQPPQPPLDPMTGQPAVNPQTGQPMPAPPDPILSQIFDVRPMDDEPVVAATRMQEFGRAMATTKFGRFPPAWQAGLVQAYQAARQAVQQQALQAQKAGEKLHLAMGLKLADLDPQQSAVILQQEGFQVPPAQPTPAAPTKQELSPEAQMQLELQKHQMTTEAELHKQRLAAETEIQKERIKAAAKVEAESRAAAQQAQLAQHLRDLMAAAHPAPVPPRTRTLRKAPDGSYTIEET